MGSWFNSGPPGADGDTQSLWERFKSSVESEAESLAREIRSATGRYTRGFGGLFPLNSLSLLEIDHYIAGSYDSPALQAPEAYLQVLVTQIKLGNWYSLRSFANLVFGPTSFSLGFLEGIGESLEGDVLGIVNLCKMFILARLYETLEHPRISLMTDPVMLGLAEALSLNQAINHEMWSCHERLKELMHDIGEIVKEPGKFFQAIGKEMKQGAKEDWDTAKRWFEHPDLHNDFQMGRAVGRVTYQIVMILLLIWGVAENAARLAARFPQLARVARVIKAGGQLEALERPERVAGQVNRTLKEVEEGMKAAGAKEPTPISRLVTAESPDAESPAYKAKLRGQEVDLKGVEAKQVQYTKRTAEQRELLRKEFDRSARSGFLKKIGTDPESVAQLKRAGLTDSDIADIAEGNVPESGDWQVHHKLPLDDNGTNDPSNLILMKNDPYHQAITNAQKALTKGMAPGDTRTLDFPVPAGDGVVYPSIPAPEE
jgi:hypothetical protein